MKHARVYKGKVHSLKCCLVINFLTAIDLDRNQNSVVYFLGVFMANWQQSCVVWNRSTCLHLNIIFEPPSKNFSHCVSNISWLLLSQPLIMATIYSYQSQVMLFYISRCYTFNMSWNTLLYVALLYKHFQALYKVIW